MKKTQWKGALILLAAAFIWGSTVVAQSIGSESLQAFTYNAIRTLMGAAVLLPVIVLREKRANRNLPVAEKRTRPFIAPGTWRVGALLGAVLCIAANLQQLAFSYTTPGKIAFITALYMLFVPLMGLFLGKKVPPLLWGCVAVGAVGLYFLSIPAGGFTALNRGDLLSIGGAVFFAVQILLVERFAADNDPIKLSFVQFIVSGALSCVLMLLFEHPTTAAVRAAVWPLLYAGVLSSGVAYTLQVIGQRQTESTLASLIMCAESVFGVLSAAMVLHQIPTGREMLGCGLMLTAIVAAVLTGKPRGSRKATTDK